MDRRRVGYVIAVVGLVLLVASALADPIGIGEGGGLGWKQTAGILVGAGLVAVGAWLAYARGRRTASES